MAVAAPPWQERVEKLATYLLQKDKSSIISIRGSTGRGKTRLLRDVASQLANRGAIPLYLSPPQGEEDTAGAALAEAADILKAHRLLNGQTAGLRDLRVTRDQKIKIILDGINKASNSVVLMMDEPSRWVAGEWFGESSASARRFASQVSKELATYSNCRIVYTGSNFGGRTDEEPYHLPRAWNDSDLPRQLTDHSAWKEVSKGLGSTFIEQATPLLCRMLAMLSAFSTPEDAAAAARTSLGVKEIARLLEQSCGNYSPQLLRAWACFSLVRRVIDDRLYNRLANELDTELRFVAEELLLTRVEGGYELHPVLAQSINPRKILNANYTNVHVKLANYYLECEDSFSNATEAFFHSTEAWDDDLMARTKPFFVEQLHLQGRSLSRQKRHGEAAEIFRQAVELDSADDYAHHYRAFNLDWIAEDQSTIEGEYQQAIHLNSRHPWWHSRWINYLITVGKSSEARSAFAEASESLQEVMETQPDHVYRSLHSWVVALLLHRAQLDFARQVLNCVPVEVRREHRGFVALEEKLIALEEARRGRGVFPLSVPASQHWRKSPHLDFPPQIVGKELRAWHPARVEALTEREILLVVGKAPEGSNPPTYGRINLSLERFNAATLDDRAASLGPGRFLELAFYGDEGILKIRAHHKTSLEDPDLPYLNPPDTLRYLRKQERSL